MVYNQQRNSHTETKQPATNLKKRRPASIWIQRQYHNRLSKRTKKQRQDRLYRVERSLICRFSEHDEFFCWSVIGQWRSDNIAARFSRIRCSFHDYLEFLHFISSTIFRKQKGKNHYIHHATEIRLLIPLDRRILISDWFHCHLFFRFTVLSFLQHFRLQAALNYRCSCQSTRRAWMQFLPIISPVIGTFWIDEASRTVDYLFILSSFERTPRSGKLLFQSVYMKSRTTARPAWKNFHSPQIFTHFRSRILYRGPKFVV